MPEKKELEEVMKWCDERMETTNRVSLIEQNPFRERFGWTFRFPYIEINVPIERANKHNLVYDRATRTLWQYLNDKWQKIEADFEIE